MARVISLRFLLAALPFATLAAAQPQTALLDYDSSVAAANATGVYELPSLLLDSNGIILSNDSSQAWHLTQTVTRYSSDLVTIGSSYLTSPSSMNSSLQYVACARWFSVPDNIASASQDDGSCSSIISADCIRDLKNQYLTEAAALEDQDRAANTACGKVFASVAELDYPASCRNPTWSISQGSQGLLSESILVTSSAGITNVSSPSYLDRR